MQWSRKEQNTIVMFHTVISQSLKESFTFWNDRKVIDYVTDFTVSWNLLDFFGLFHKWHEIFHQIKLVKNENKLFDRNFQFSFYKNRDCLIKMLCKNFVKRAIFFVYPSLRWQLFFIRPYILHFLFYCIKKRFILFIDCITKLSR